MKKSATSKQLPSNFFKEMLSIELNLQTHETEFQDIDKLIQLYAQAIEYYDSRKDQIKDYFMEKMQILLFNKEALRILIQEQERIKVQQSGGNSLSISFEERPKSTTPSNRRKKRNSKVLGFGIQEVGCSDESDSDDDYHHPTIGGRDWVNTSIDKRMKTNIVGKTGSERSRDFNFMIQMEKEKKDEHQILEGLLKVYVETNKTNDEVIKKSLDLQYKQLREKIAIRKTQNFQSQFISMSKDRSIEKGWGSLLAELAEEERDGSKISTEQSNKDTTIQSKNVDSNPSLGSQKDLEVTQNTAETEHPDFPMSPIKQEEQQKVSKKDGLVFFGSKNNPKYKDANPPTTDATQY